MTTPSNYRAGYVLDPELTSLSLVRQAVAAGIPVRVEPVNDVVLCDEVCIVKLFVEKTSRPKGAVCGRLIRKVAAIFKAHVNAMGFISRIEK